MEPLLDTKTLFNLVGGQKEKNKRKHDVGKMMDIVPFTTKRTKAVRNGLHELLGEYVRNICGLTYNEKGTELEEPTFLGNPFVGKIMKDIEVETDAEYNLERFLNQYLFGQDSRMNPIHPYLFNYIPVPEAKENELIKYAQFIYQILVQEDERVAVVFQNRETEDILTELILSNLSLSKKQDQRKSTKFQPMLNEFAESYREDLLFLKDYKEYFLNSFPLLTQFYTFVYICQLLWKFEEFENADYTQLKPLYFALDWESSVGKRRRAADEIEGYKRIQDKSQNLFVHIHTISQLSHNRLSNPDQESDSKLKKVFSYPQLIQTIQSHGKEAEEQFLQELNAWIQEYASIRISEDERETGKEIIRDITGTMPETLADAFRLLFRCLKEGMNTEACVKFGNNIEDVGGTVFLKNRGRSGVVFNMTHEMIILLTAVCVKDKRIPLNRLFEEYERRGVAFDRQSRKEIIQLFDSLNILDKKSDSGDAQYVKPIL